MAVRVAQPGDEAVIRELRLAALADAPDAFLSTYEREAARPLEDWRRWMAPGAVFLFEDAGLPKGLVSAVPDAGNGRVVVLAAMWVEPSARRTGAADALVQAVVAWARQRGADRVRLRVESRNDRARRCYERNGFAATGTPTPREKGGLMDVEMGRELRAAAGGSLWMEGATATASPLVGDVDADVAIVGAGYTGLSAAIALREAGHAVVVLEADHVGFGASGRNAGHLTPVVGKDLPTLALLFRRRARDLVALAELGVERVERMIAEHAIDCAYEPVGNVLAAVHPKQHKMLDKAAKAAAELGLASEMLEPEAMRARDLPAAFGRGLLMRRGGILNPGRYVQGLRRVAEAKRALVFERTPVVRIEEGSPALLVTPSGRVRARAVVLATNAYTPALGWLRGTIARFHVYLFATAPLGESDLASVGWRGREGVYTAHEMLESYRLTADGRIVGGAKTVRYGFDGRALADDPATFAFIERAFRERFPMLGHVPVTHRWGGPIAFALDFLPAVGVTGAYRNVYYSVGYAGHGIALGTYGGTMIADLLLGRDGPGRVLWAHRKAPMPPEPLRWLVARGLVAGFGAIDRRVDRLVRDRRT